MTALRVAAYQGPAIERNPEMALDKALTIAVEATAQNVDILCFPECYLHGYFEDASKAKYFSIDLKSDQFQKLCSRFTPILTTVILGLNEKCGDQLFNSAVVIEAGRHLGTYRKAYTYPPYNYYTEGREFPIFRKKGIPFGVLICIDSLYLEPARILALRGARILFCPSFNRIPVDSSLPPYMNQRHHLIARSGENDCWLLMSDVTWKDDRHVCPGHSVILDRDGSIVRESAAFVEGILVHDISLESLETPREERLQGRSELVQRVHSAYTDRYSTTHLKEG